MTTHSSTIGSIIRYCSIDIVANFFYWPVWWYSRGLYLVSRYILLAIGRLETNLGVRLMFVTLLQPMYGQNDREGRLISFVMRLVLLLSRSVVFVMISIGWIGLLFFWLIVPVVIVSRLISFFS